MGWWCANELESRHLSPVDLNEYNLRYIGPIGVRPIGDET